MFLLIRYAKYVKFNECIFLFIKKGNVYIILVRKIEHMWINWKQIECAQKAVLNKYWKIIYKSLMDKSSKINKKQKDKPLKLKKISEIIRIKAIENYYKEYKRKYLYILRNWMEGEIKLNGTTNMPIRQLTDRTKQSKILKNPLKIIDPRRYSGIKPSLLSNRKGSIIKPSFRYLPSEEDMINLILETSNKCTTSSKHF